MVAVLGQVQTLLRRLLNNHSRIYCGSEIKFFEDFFNNYAIKDDLKNIRFFNTARNILPEDQLILLFGNSFTRLHEQEKKQEKNLDGLIKTPQT